MKSIEEQIEALTQELRPVQNTTYYFFNADGRIYSQNVSLWDFVKYAEEEKHPGVEDFLDRHVYSLFISTNKAEVEEYADCYKRLKLYQLIGKKKEKEFPLDWSGVGCNYGTDFGVYTSGQTKGSEYKWCVLAGVWFARNEDRLEAIKTCGIDQSFQKKCAKYGIGGA